MIRRREEATREFFARGGASPRAGPPSELAAYLTAFAPLLRRRRLAVDVGTGDGALLEVLSPVFERVIGLDRADAQLALAAERVRRRELPNVTLVCGDAAGPEVRAAMGEGGADVVFASRILHHAPVPSRVVRALVELARPAAAQRRGGAVALLDYEAHDDQALRELEADLWLGFEPRELKRLARDAGLRRLRWQRVPCAWRGDGPDRHLRWQLLVGFRADTTNQTNDSTRGRDPS